MLHGASPRACHQRGQRATERSVLSLAYFQGSTYSVGIRFGIKYLIFYCQGVERGKTSLLALSEEVFLGKNLDNVVGMLIILQP